MLSTVHVVTVQQAAKNISAYGSLLMCCELPKVIVAPFSKFQMFLQISSSFNNHDYNYTTRTRILSVQCNKILKMTTTRISVSCVIFGPPCQLPGNMLPTYEDIFKYYNLVKFQLKKASNGKDPSHSEISSKVTAEIEALWEKASLPVVSHDRVRAMLKTFHQKYRNLLKPYQTRKEKNSYKAKLLAFKQEAMKLFDICTCKCRGEFC